MNVRERQEEEDGNKFHLIVAVDRASDLPAAARDRLPECQSLVTMVTGCCIGILVVELQSALGQESLS